MPAHRLLATGKAPCLALLQTAERLWRVSFVDSLVVDELVEPNPVPPRKRTATKSSRKTLLANQATTPPGAVQLGCGTGSPTQKQAKAAQFQGMRRIGARPRE